MRETLAKLIKDTIVLECTLPCGTRGIEKSVITTNQDGCYNSINNDDLAKIIYNSILEYSYDEHDLSEGDNFVMFAHAFGNKFKYDNSSSDLSKQKYGIYGEVLLHSILHTIYSAKTFISRGYLYNPLTKGEAPGYDAYHLIEGEDEEVGFWFGEVKFYEEYKSAVDSVFKNIEKALSDDYLETNLIAITNNGGIKSKYPNSKITSILDSWNKGRIESLISEIKTHNMKLVYPILLAYEKDKKGYDESIKNIIKYINNKYSSIKFNNISIDFSVFFILLPIDNVGLIKKEIIKWIELKQPLMQ